MRGEASCDAPALCPAADLLVPSSDAAEAGVPFERLALVRHELDSYRAACSANGFDAHLASYRRLYNRTLDPSVADARVLVVRDSIARRDRGIGQQTPFLLKWLLIGFALQRPVYFQYCATEAEPWAEPEVRHRTGRRYGPMHCDQVHYDLGDYFGLLGGVDVRWRPHLHAAAMRRRGLRQTVVGACSLDERRPAPGSDGEEADTWLFLCRPAQCGPKAEAKSLLPRLRERMLRFWTSSEVEEHPFLAFEYPTLTKSYGCTGISPGLIYGPEFDRLLHQLSATPRPAPCASVPDAARPASAGQCLTGALPVGWLAGVMGHRIFVPRDSRKLEGWAACAQFALLRPTPLLRTAASRLLPRLQRRTGDGDQRAATLYSLHLRTMEVDDAACFSVAGAVTNGSAAAIDDGVSAAGAMRALDLAFAFPARRPSGCRRWMRCSAFGSLFDLSPAAPFGGLSGFVAGLLRHLPGGARLFLSTDSPRAEKLLLRAFAPRLATASDGAASFLVPTWHEGAAADPEVAARRRSSWLFAALDFYVFGLSSGIFRMDASSQFPRMAARRRFGVPIVGGAEDFCRLLSNRSSMGAAAPDGGTRGPDGPGGLEVGAIVQSCMDEAIDAGAPSDGEGSDEAWQSRRLAALTRWQGSLCAADARLWRSGRKGAGAAGGCAADEHAGRDRRAARLRGR